MNDPKITGIAAGVVGNVTDTNLSEPKKPIKNEPKDEVLKKSDENEQVAFEPADGEDDGKASFGQGLKAFWNGFVNGVKNFFGIGSKTGFADLVERKQELMGQMSELQKEALEIQANKQELLTQELNAQIEDQLKEINHGSDMDLIDMDNIDAEALKKEIEQQMEEIDEVIKKEIKSSETYFQ